ncbi:uncharacterized protein LOC127869197 [Dreissena polymorpha]|uniref:Uncharacterized protein n=1 Tax=Dreissena polymorpha TaxID=45954 RepID=A0A9D4MDR7_DREPO|nr:uncharacterized protein LOC127869197 [Dreissena polymorpha]KAH3874300.1 hypothetical protein DPMN_037542 [Dreissena polymorpha]
MAESITDSGHDTNSTFNTSVSGTIPPSLAAPKIPDRFKKESDSMEVLPPLPSHKFRYSVWHDLRQTCLTGDQLHAPRVRAGPPEKEQLFHQIEQEGIPIHHDYAGQERQQHSQQFENWEQAEVVNLSYQELQEEYQKRNLIRILKRCVSAKQINLAHNTLDNIKDVSFPRCEYINLNDNFLFGFWCLPELPAVKSLTARNNAIKIWKGIAGLKGTPLEELDLRGNPITFTINYRNMVFSYLPNLRVLDGIPRLSSDKEVDIPSDPSSCVIT